MKNRAAKGFTVIKVCAIGDPNDPNAYGDRPFLDDNPTMPNPEWFRHMDYAVAKAAEHNLVVGLLPMWGHNWKHRGTGAPLLNAGNALAYGEFLGRRYRWEANSYAKPGSIPPAALSTRHTPRTRKASRPVLPRRSDAVRTGCSSLMTSRRSADAAV